MKRNVEAYSSSKVMAMHGGSSIPIKCHEAPCQRTCKDGAVYELGSLGEAEVCKCQLEKIDDDE